MRLIKLLIREFINLIPALIYFIVTFNLIVLTENLMLRQYTNTYISYTLATIGALIAAKALLIINHIPYVNAFPKKPLMYNIVWKIFVFGILVLLIRILEKMLDFYFQFHNFQAAYFKIFHVVKTPTFWSIQIWIFLLFTFYIIASEFIRVIGKDKILKLLLGNRN
jgi:hypothetical protein